MAAAVAADATRMSAAEAAITAAGAMVVAAAVVAAASALAWLVVAALAGGVAAVAAAVAEATGAGATATGCGVVDGDKEKLRSAPTCINRLRLCVSKRGLGNRPPAQCAVRRGLGLDRSWFAWATRHSLRGMRWKNSRTASSTDRACTVRSRG
jgi:hypothetical protein